jgi:hypothetical protein
VADASASIILHKTEVYVMELQCTELTQPIASKPAGCLSGDPLRVQPGREFRGHPNLLFESAVNL